MIGTISMFNWNGNLMSDIKNDERKFNLKFTHKPLESCMGFEMFTVEGEESDISSFLSFYALELNVDCKLESVETGE